MIVRAGAQRQKSYRMKPNGKRNSYHARSR
jgi:hypothetical protein